MIECFDFELFLAYANVIDIFVDRTFGDNFDSNNERDRSFIDLIRGIEGLKSRLPT
jgi:hypothetical protein